MKTSLLVFYLLTTSMFAAAVHADQDTGAVSVEDRPADQLAHDGRLTARWPSNGPFVKAQPEFKQPRAASTTQPRTGVLRESRVDAEQHLRRGD